MKKGIFLQVVIIVLIILGWNCFHIGYNYQKQVFENNLSHIPMIVFSMDLNSLDSLFSDISELSYIKETIIESDSTVSEKIIADYGLNGAQNILEKYALPNVMSIYFDGGKFKSVQKDELEKKIRNYPEIIMNYDIPSWNVSQRKIKILYRTYLIGNGLFILLLLFIMVFLRIHFEMKSNEFWKIFRTSGGTSKIRRKQFLINSLWTSLFPIAFIFIVYFAAIYFQYLQIEIDYRLFGIEFAAMLFSTLIARISLGKNI
ncbi:MAG: hypothetical protein K8R49_08835 [Candidatus Cloacimonetes bacterium]|nr:hypothetical protein [Candidatus Cloacimonadota bacterium]